MAELPAHGTPKRYQHGPDENDEPGGCRCTPCTRAAVRSIKEWRLTGHRLVDAEPVRQHVIELKRAGLPYSSIAALAPVKPVVVYRLLNGEPDRGVPPTKRMRPENAAALLAVHAEQVGGGRLVLSVGSVRRLRALARAGWSTVRLAAETGLNHQHLGWVANGHSPTVSVGTARAIADAYNRLWMTDPVAAGIPRAAHVRTLATRRGWVSALAWDDDLIDLPDDVLKAELRRRVNLMDPCELQRCNDSHYRQGDLSPLVVAASREYERRRARKRTAA